MRFRWLVALPLVAPSACTSIDDATPASLQDSAVIDGGPDTPPVVDAPIDSASDASIGSGSDAGIDSGTDAGMTCAAWTGATDGTAKVLGTYVLAKSTSMKIIDPLLTDPDVAAGVGNGALADDPGPGSGLEYLGGCRFLMVTDRGPNLDHATGSKTDGKVFPLLPFTPSFVTVRAETAAMIVESALPILDAAGLAVTGLPNGDPASKFYDAVFTSASATTALTFDATAGGFAVGARHASGGLDTEDVRRLPSGDLVVVDEYSPSLAIVDGTTGRVKVRYVPAGLSIASAPYPVKAILPAIFLQRRSNKGFEGLAVTPDGKTAYAVLQAPMGDDKSAAYGDSLVNRIVALDLGDPLDAKVLGQYLVLHDTAVSYGAAAKDQSKVYFNSATFLRANHLLALERVSGRMRLVDLDLSAATKIVDGAPGADTLDPEDVTGTTGKGYAALGLVPAMRTVVFDTADLPTGSLYVPSTGSDVDPDKIEGLAVIDESTFAITNDDDFGIGTNPGELTRIWVIRPKTPFALH